MNTNDSMYEYDKYDEYALDEAEFYEQQFNLQQRDRRMRRGSKPKSHPAPKPRDAEIVERLADTAGLESGFNPTYRPSKYEAGWLLQSLQALYEQQMITDVEALVKGGKEASVYRCTAGPALPELGWVAAKVYRPRQFRQLRNDKMYREGREILTANGRPVKKTDHRLMRAIGKKTAFGVEVSHTSWLMHEFTTLQQLHAAGAAVPQALGTSGNAILMSYIGDDRMAAPALSEIRLDRDEAAPLFDETLRNVELMLAMGMIHGDLSAYNILYWEGAITLIDFPQVAGSRSNPHARAIFERDVRRVCEYFARYGVERDPAALTHALWERYWAVELDDVLADLSRLDAPDEDEIDDDPDDDDPDDDEV